MKQTLGVIIPYKKGNNYAPHIWELHESQSLGTEEFTIARFAKSEGLGSESIDSFITDITILTCPNNLKTDAPCQRERVVMLNQLHEIAEEHGSRVDYAGKCCEGTSDHDI